MLLRLNYRKPLLVATILIASLGMFSCSDDDTADLKPAQPAPSTNINHPGDTNTTPRIEPSKMDLLTSHPWVLAETYENGVNTQSSGTGVYEYTTKGEFKFETGTQGWMKIGVYAFQGDSTSMLLELTGTPLMTVSIDKLDENDLHTSFTTRGKDFIYKYRKQ